MTIAIRKHTKLDITFLKSCPILLYFSSLCQILARIVDKKQQDDNELLFSKEREIVENIYSKILDKIDELSKKKGYDQSKFIANSTGLEIDFNELKDPW